MFNRLTNVHGKVGVMLVFEKQGENQVNGRYRGQKEGKGTNNVFIAFSLISDCSLRACNTQDN